MQEIFWLRMERKREISLQKSTPRRRRGFSSQNIISLNGKNNNTYQEKTNQENPKGK